MPSGLNYDTVQVYLYLALWRHHRMKPLSVTMMRTIQKSSKSKFKVCSKSLHFGGFYPALQVAIPIKLKLEWNTYTTITMFILASSSCFLQFHLSQFPSVYLPQPPNVFHSLSSFHSPDPLSSIRLLSIYFRLSAPPCRLLPYLHFSSLLFS